MTGEPIKVAIVPFTAGQTSSAPLFASLGLIKQPVQRTRAPDVVNLLAVLFPPVPTRVVPLPMNASTCPFVR